MTILPKGGRGHKVPYQTCTVRIPSDIRELVEAMANYYRLAVLQGKEFEASGTRTELAEAMAIAKKLLRQKRSVKHIIVKLLQVIYKVELDEKDFE